MKKSTRLLILILVLLVLLGVVFGLQNQGENQGDTETESKLTVVDIKKEDVIRISYDYEGETYSFEKEEGVWYYAPDHSLEVTQAYISTMAAIVGPFKAEQSISDVSDMAQYGLTENVRTIRFDTETDSYIFEVGAYNSMSDVYYMRKPSDTTVYAVSSVTVSVFDKRLEDVVKNLEETTE